MIITKDAMLRQGRERQATLTLSCYRNSTWAVQVATSTWCRKMVDTSRFKLRRLQRPRPVVAVVDRVRLLQLAQLALSRRDYARVLVDPRLHLDRLAACKDSKPLALVQKNKWNFAFPWIKTLGCHQRVVFSRARIQIREIFRTEVGSTCKLPLRWTPTSSILIHYYWVMQPVGADIQINSDPDLRPR